MPGIWVENNLTERHLVDAHSIKDICQPKMVLEQRIVTINCLSVKWFSVKSRGTDQPEPSFIFVQ